MIANGGLARAPARTANDLFAPEPWQSKQSQLSRPNEAGSGPKQRSSPAQSARPRLAGPVRGAARPHKSAGVWASLFVAGSQSKVPHHLAQDEPAGRPAATIARDKCDQAPTCSTATCRPQLWPRAPRYARRRTSRPAHSTSQSLSSVFVFSCLLSLLSAPFDSVKRSGRAERMFARNDILAAPRMLLSYATRGHALCKQEAQNEFRPLDSRGTNLTWPPG